MSAITDTPLQSPNILRHWPLIALLLAAFIATAPICSVRNLTSSTSFACASRFVKSPANASRALLTFICAAASSASLETISA